MCWDLRCLPLAFSIMRLFLRTLSISHTLPSTWNMQDFSFSCLLHHACPSKCLLHHACSSNCLRQHACPSIFLLRYVCPCNCLRYYACVSKCLLYHMSLFQANSTSRLSFHMYSTSRASPHLCFVTRFMPYAFSLTPFIPRTCFKVRVLCYVLAQLCVALSICLYHYSQRQVLPSCVRDRPSVNCNTICAAHIPDLISGFHRALLQSITFISLLNTLNYTKLRG